MLLDIQNKVDITRNFGELEMLLIWCENNCIGKWTFVSLEPAGVTKGAYEFYFENDTDKINFILWQK